MTSGEDSVRVATGGTVDLSRKCQNCGGALIYRVVPGTETVLAMFCEAVGCSEFLMEVPFP